MSASCAGCPFGAALSEDVVVTTGPAGAPSAAWTDERLVAACLEGDEQAWSVLIDRHRALVFAMARRYGASPVDASDIFQAVCIDLVVALPRLRADNGIGGWMATVAVHQAYRWKQRRAGRVEHEQRDPETQPVSPAGGPQHAIERADEDRVVRAALAGLAPRCRRLLGLLFYQDPPVPYVVVAGQLGLAEGSVRAIRARCLKRLKVAVDRALACDRSPLAVAPRAGHDRSA